MLCCRQNYFGPHPPVSLTSFKNYMRKWPERLSYPFQFQFCLLFLEETCPFKPGNVRKIIVAMGNKSQQIFQAASRHKPIIILTIGSFSYYSESEVMLQHSSLLYLFFFFYFFILQKVKDMVAGTASCAVAKSWNPWSTIGCINWAFNIGMCTSKDSDKW